VWDEGRRGWGRGQPEVATEGGCLRGGKEGRGGEGCCLYTLGLSWMS
jgi:hypothetical protein